MKNKKITRSITQGVYVLTTNNGGCIVDAVSQVSASEEPLISVAVMKKNYTRELLEKNEKFILSVLAEDADGEIIKTFGLNSMKDIDKFANKELFTGDEIKIVKDSIGYMECEIVDRIDMDTHLLIIGRLKEADVFEDKKPMSYGYYQEHKDELLKVNTMEGKVAWVCTLCGYVYFGETLPDDYICPRCGAGKEFFEKKEG